MVFHAVVSLIAGLACAAMALAACGGGDAPSESRTTTVALPPGTNYVVIPPVTTTTTTEVAVTVPVDGVDPNEQMYTVQPGDSLSRIASLHGLTNDELVLYNAWPEGVDHVFQAGETVRIPAGSKVPDSGSSDAGSSDVDAGSSEDSAPPGIACEHTVVEGDNQGRVANQYDVTLEALAEANATNSNWNYFPLGSQFHIPEGGSC